jgi:glycosyltransferase involved in cell wall biosynthesis
MSCGVVPICTAVGGIPDVIVDGETGFLSDLSLESYKSKIIEYLNSDIDKSYLIQNYKAKYSMEKCAEEYLEVYTEKQVL